MVLSVYEFIMIRFTLPFLQVVYVLQASKMMKSDLSKDNRIIKKRNSTSSQIEFLFLYKALYCFFLAFFLCSFVFRVLYKLLPKSKFVNMNF